ncbi:hypothetical protein HFO56_23165 [Rhizobium laguerreae]|uniref:hypothetical protein n=1 Tax=Rhizobium laguerreae TaxID=1076926 RepID=UPI001C9299CF|nr:hypothetical protein [Rhizobium laguerreae]MBY3155226.1 hypothetical protein [Rhizobium laguerreae]MBY3432725.1 hypothetical protein [Rhizobium laguerreae]
MAVSAPSLATDDDVRAYTSGDSHALAVALHRRFGWKLLVVTDSRDPFWVDPDNPENTIPSVVHVYALDSNNDAWDIRGKRPRVGIRDDMYELFNVQDFAEDECGDEGELCFYVGVWSDTGEPVVRPLPDYSEDDLVAAETVIVRVYPNVPVALIEKQGLQRPFPR